MPTTRVRCCTTKAGAPDECADLGSPGTFVGSVCGTDHNPGVPPITLDPVTGGAEDATLEKAAIECSIQGAQLCTAQQLADKVCCGTGCQADGNYVWSSTGCDPPCLPGSLQ